MGRKPRGFHTPFADLHDRIASRAAPSGGEARPAGPGSAAPRPSGHAALALRPATAAASPAAERDPVEDGGLFLEEMGGVAPLPADPRGFRGVAETSREVTRSRRAREEAEAYAQLADLVEGSGAFDLSATDEYVEGIAPGIDRRLLRRLKRGEYAVQAHVDLHGLTADAARAEVEHFIDASRTAGHRCLLVIHGRGQHSKEGIPVLKERLKVWLTRGRIARAVLAFSTARPSDGGAGALYILLRR